MPFTPLPLLVLYDDTRGRCGPIIPRLVEMLEQRGFEVDTHRIEDGPVDIDRYRGVVLGAPTFGLGVRDLPPTDALTEYLESLDGIEEKQIAVFTVYNVWPGNALERLKGLVLRVGARFVAHHGYSRLHPEQGDHALPTECMVRIR
jgi:flavorubredoxin